MSATPMATRRRRFETTYGNTMSTTPQTRGTTAYCFLPYIKKPSPMEPKRKPQRSDDVLNAVSLVV